MSLAPVMAALGDETRLHIVTKLCKNGPLSITQLVQGADISRQGVTKHLYALKHAGIVRSERRGREHIWKLERKRIEEARRYLAQISQQWDGALSRLRAAVEHDR